jgi:hypothetical protein
MQAIGKRLAKRLTKPFFQTAYHTKELIIKLSEFIEHSNYKRI